MRRKSMTQWEYKIIKLAQMKGYYDCAQTELYLLGKEGWEVINAWYAVSGIQAYAILKRQVSIK
jgi:hypothetical protein